MTLPLHLQMEIDIHTQLHQREVAAGFAAARARMPLGAEQTYSLLRSMLANSSAAQLAMFLPGEAYMLRTMGADYWFGANQAPSSRGLGLWP